MTCGSFSSPAMTSAGSPGSRCCSRKMIRDTKSSVGRSCSSLLPKKVSMEVTTSDSRFYNLSPMSRSVASYVPGRGEACLASTSIETLAPRERPNLNSKDPSLELQADHAHQAIGQLPVALQPGGMRDQDTAVIEVELGNILEDDFGQLLIHGLALRHVGERASLVEQPVGLRIAVAWV